MNNMNIRRLEQKIISNEPGRQNLNKNINKKVDFQTVLNRLIDQEEIKFSKHAKERIESREINIDEADLDKLNRALEKAESKGIKDALILMENQAFIANIKNKTIVTAIGEENIRDKVFTNIDGTLII